MKNLVEELRQNEKQWVTEMGAWFPGERVVFRGKDLLTDLLTLDFAQIIYFAVNGKIYKDEILNFMSTANTVCSSFPEPRLWNNRVAALAGTTRSTGTLALAAATAVSEATVYGKRPDIRSNDFIRRANRKIEDGDTIENVVESELKKYRALPGFGRPVTNQDERIKPLLENARKAGVADGKHLKLAFEIEKYLIEKRRRFKLNVDGVLSAIAADLEMSPREYYMFCLLSFSAGIFACYLDALDHGEGEFFPFSVERINYKGEAKRSW